MQGRRFFILILLSLSCYAYAQRAARKINIWQNTDISRKVELIPFLVEGNANTAVIICPGGSYFWHDMKSEGRDVARWLNKNGISAFILKYSTAGTPTFLLHTRIFSRHIYPDAQNDLRQALLYLRNNAQSFRINPAHVGVMGFSAGGHLVMSVAERPGTLASRPDFVAAVYPVVSMSHKTTHKRSRRALMGNRMKHSLLMRDSLSTEKNVTHDCPPVFLVNCKDDPVVNPYNACLLDSALTANHVAHAFIRYNTGGHGFGANDKKGSAECRTWKAEFLKWLNKIL